MYKMGDAWLWTCEHPTGCRVGDVFHVGDWRSAWDACLGAVTKHALLYHVEGELVAEVELGETP